MGKLNDVNGPHFRAGYVAIIGEPNVGKSTLMNSLIGQKISIVTNKPQTTRHKILGILSRDDYQLIFLDTPGLLQPKYLLHRAMMKSAFSAIDDADIILLMIDVTKPKTKEDTGHNIALKALERSHKPLYLILNKIDLVKKADLVPLISNFGQRCSFKNVFPISALNLDGTEGVLKALVSELPEHPPYYPLDIVSEHSERFFVGEIIREKIFEIFREEVPYSTTVDVIDYKEQEGRKDLINAEIYVERASQKSMLIGKQGSALKRIGERARKDIEAFLGRKVYLELHVKVREKWREKAAWLKRLGYQ
ncbi:MAG: GTPase Era [Ignavibacteria bacterium]|nr:GTPase Era [Ignavibacteria bacterium]